MSSSACHDGPSSSNDVEKAPVATVNNVPGSPSPENALDASGSELEAVGATEAAPAGGNVAAARIEGVTPIAQEPKVDENITVPSQSAAPLVAAPAKPKKKKINPGRCGQCRKKIGLLGFKCQCEIYFCGGCRMAEAHNCTFDYKSSGRDQLAKNNTPVLASKLNKI